MNPAQIRATIDLALILLIVFCTWYLTSDHYQKIIAQQQVETDKAVQAQLAQNQTAAAAHAAQLKTAEEQHAKDQLALNNLRGQLGRVQIHIPSGCTVSGGTEAGADPDRTARLLSARVDAAFARLQDGVGQLLQRCDQMNIDAMQSNEASR